MPYAPRSGVRDEVADVDEAADRGEDAEGHAEDLLHDRAVTSRPGSSMNSCSCAEIRRSGRACAFQPIEFPASRERCAAATTASFALVQQLGPRRDRHGVGVAGRAVARCRTRPCALRDRRSPTPTAAPRRSVPKAIATACPRGRRGSPSPRRTTRSRRCPSPCARSHRSSAPVRSGEAPPTARRRRR